MNLDAQLIKLNIQVDLNSISMSKNDPKNNIFHKYDVEATIDEIENAETHSTFKYGFTVLSNPKNVRLFIEGITKISGDSKERDDVLTKDENDVPKILSIIYQELFPTFFLLSKSLNVSCPPIQIGGMGAGGATSEISEDVEPVTAVQENLAVQEDLKQKSAEDLIDDKEIIQPTV
jgi:hypothetical protein